MAGQGRLICGLVLGLLGGLGVTLTCGLPMWRESSASGANVITAQTLWDGLWLHCVFQATGQMQCKRHVSPSLTTDLQAGRALTLISIICAFIGFMVALLGGGVVNCRGRDPETYQYGSSPQQFIVLDPYQYERRRRKRKRACISGAVLCALSGVLCLVSVSWSAAITTLVNNDQLVLAALKRDVGTAVYVGMVSSLLLLLAAALIGLICWDKDRLPPPTYYSDRIYSDNAGTARTDRTELMSSTGSQYTYPVSPPGSVYSKVQRGQRFAPQYPPQLWGPVYLQEGQY